MKHEYATYMQNNFFFIITQALIIRKMLKIMTKKKSF